MTFYNQHSTALVGAAGQPEGYTIERSLRFRSSASAYLNRTPSTTTNRKTWTWSGWVKRAKPGSNGLIFAARTGAGATYTTLVFSSVDDLRMESNTETAYPLYKTSALFRDPSAWYHIVVALDTTQATSTNRLKIYVNGVLQTAASYNVPAQNTDLAVNSTETHLIGQQASGSYFDGYLTEINFIDGQALDPSYFGETDTVTGVWKPKAFAGSYGTNGFYLNFSDNTSTTTLGYDTSGNSNNWTTNNISLTAGSTYDSMKDVPTLTDADAGNYCTLNPLVSTDSALSYSDGNLYLSGGGTTLNTRTTMSTISVSSGKWYAEITVGTTNNAAYCGVIQPSNLGVSRDTCWNYYDGLIYPSGAGGFGTASSGNVIGIAFDADNGTVQFYKNGATNGAQQTGLTTGVNWSFYAEMGSGGQVQNWNFGQRPFAYTPPSGFKALNTYNLPTPTVKDGSDYFNTLLWTGTGATRSITGVGFTPDFVWIKKRSSADRHCLFDAVRGAAKQISSDLTSAESTPPNALNSFDSDGYTVGNSGNINDTGFTYVGWNWKANGSGVSNTDGSITSTVSANTSSGFSIVSYSGNSSGAQTVGHGLGVAPDFITIKQRTAAGNSWMTYTSMTGNGYWLGLNLTNAATVNSNLWQNTSPTSSVFTLGVDSSINNTGQDYIAYCFAPIEGYSAFGKYTGNGSADGPFVYTGFRPACIIVKQTNAVTDWMIHDSARDPYNVVKHRLHPNFSYAESTNIDLYDFTSSGFKLRTSTASWNASGGTFIYAAFAENPFKYSLAR